MTKSSIFVALSSFVAMTEGRKMGIHHVAHQKLSHDAPNDKIYGELQGFGGAKKQVVSWKVVYNKILTTGKKDESASVKKDLGADNKVETDSSSKKVDAKAEATSKSTTSPKLQDDSVFKKDYLKDGLDTSDEYPHKDKIKTEEQKKMMKEMVAQKDEIKGNLGNLDELRKKVAKESEEKQEDDAEVIREANYVAATKADIASQEYENKNTHEYNLSLSKEELEAAKKKHAQEQEEYDAAAAKLEAKVAELKKMEVKLEKQLGEQKEEKEDAKQQAVTLEEARAKLAEAEAEQAAAEAKFAKMKAKLDESVGATTWGRVGVIVAVTVVIGAAAGTAYFYFL